MVLEIGGADVVPSLARGRGAGDRRGTEPPPYGIGAPGLTWRKMEAVATRCRVRAPSRADVADRIGYRDWHLAALWHTLPWQTRFHGWHGAAYSEIGGGMGKLFPGPRSQSLFFIFRCI